MHYASFCVTVYFSEFHTEGILSVFLGKNNDWQTPRTFGGLDHCFANSFNGVGLVRRISCFLVLFFKEHNAFKSVTGPVNGAWSITNWGFPMSSRILCLCNQSNNVGRCNESRRLSGDFNRHCGSVLSRHNGNRQVFRDLGFGSLGYCSVLVLDWNCSADFDHHYFGG